jgi:hypothetical protein
MKCAISHEDTLFGTELQLMRIIRTEIGPAGAPEGTKKIVIGFFFEHSKVRRVTLNDSTWQSINQICCCEEGFILIFLKAWMLDQFFWCVRGHNT